MIQESLYKEVLKKISVLGLSPKTDDKYGFQDTIKQLLLSDQALTFNFIDKHTFEVEIRKEEYSTAIFSDYYFGNQRIQIQKQHLDILLNTEQQVAWVMVTTYYAAFFMATEIAKLFGIYMVNFTEEDMQNLLARSKPMPNDVIDNDITNYAYQVKVSDGEYDGFIKLSFYKKSIRPHVEVWQNLKDIMLPIHKNQPKGLKIYSELLLNICDGSKSWNNPSKIRNDWNYKYALYYAEKGTEIGNNFLKLANNYNSSMQWAGKHGLRATDPNIAASLAYVYHCLDQVINKINNKLNF